LEAAGGLIFPEVSSKQKSTAFWWRSLTTSLNYRVLELGVFLYPYLAAVLPLSVSEVQRAIKSQATVFFRER